MSGKSLVRIALLAALFLVLWLWPLSEARQRSSKVSGVLRAQTEDISSYEALREEARGLTELYIFKAPKDPKKRKTRRRGAGQLQRAQFALAPAVLYEIWTLGEMRRQAKRLPEFGVLVWPADSERLGEVRKMLLEDDVRRDRRLLETPTRHATLLQLRSRP